ncbi:MAG: pyridoxamine 5'-phosphate oxidase family protein [Phycisphaerae bacterium]|nr:pyridoxamine 5'-phosphate oxidase family protein [Phycisphaerae bacterium]
MEREAIFKFMNDNPKFALATSHNGQAHVRTITLYRADANGIVFIIGKHKMVYQHLIANPSVELCFCSPEENTQVRVRGNVRISGDIVLRNEIATDVPALKPWIMKQGDNGLAICLLENPKAKLWKMTEDYATRITSTTAMSSVWLAMYNGE